MKRTTPICPILWKRQIFYLARKHIFLLFFISTTIASSAISPQQEIEITGRVTDASTGEGLPGVNIVVEGTSIGEITDNEGNFRITVPGESSILVFSYVGYATKSVTVGSQRIINLSLTQEAQQMEELVFIGYGTIKKSDLTGAVSSVNNKDIKKADPVNIQTALQGRAAGVYVSHNSGVPGADPVIRIRGTGSINPHSPIYVIDGIIMDNSDFRNVANTINFLNPADIASIEVLKDASATAIYGSRGANGVILISTHKGFDSSPKVEFSAQIGFSKVGRTKEVMGADEYIDYIRTAHFNGYLAQPGSNPDADPDTINALVIRAIEQYNKGYDTDWVDEVIRDRPALTQNYNLSIRGGTNDARYASSFGYYNEEGIIMTNSNYRRFSFRINSDYNLGKYIHVGENLVISHMDTKGEPTAFLQALGGAMKADPLSPVLKPEGEVDPLNPLYEYNKYGPTLFTYNPVALQSRSSISNHNLTIFGNIFMEAILLRDLKFRSSLGLNLASSSTDDFQPEYYISPSDQNGISTVSNSNFSTNGWLWENTLTYNKISGKHHITVLAGFTAEHTRFEYISASKQGTPTNDIEMRTLDAATVQAVVNGGYEIITMASLLGRINYFYDDRYLVTASIRRDGTSKFGSDEKWGVFPSGSVGWRISKENFFEGVNSDIISDFKLRAGYGQIGNSSMSGDNYQAYISLITSTPNLRALFDNQPYTGYFYKSIGTHDLSWETSEQMNAGLDLGLFRNALIITADYYIRTTRDMLMPINPVDYAGYPDDDPNFTLPWINAGTMENRGYEIELAYKGNAGSFTYETSANITSYNNKVISLPGDNPIIHNLFNVVRTDIGHPVGSFYGYKTDGIFQTDEDVLDHVSPNDIVLQPTARPGDFRFKNLDGDDEISATDQTFIGNPHPDFVYGFTINLGYGGFDLMTFWQGVAGIDIWNNNKGNSLNGSFNGPREYYLEAWRGEGTSKTQPLMTTDNTNNNYRASDYYVEDGSYLRMKNIQLGYTLPTNLSNKLHISSCRFWIGGTDLLTFTNYTGNDPEVDMRNPLRTGLDYYSTYPRSRRITVGVNVEF